jgi:uncharacterized membrane protein
MAGMLQIITYLLAFYLVIKGVEVLQVGMASTREHRGVLLIVGWLTLAACVAGAGFFVVLQDAQATSLSSSMSSSIPRF